MAGTVKIKAKLVVTPEGDWAVYGSSNGDDEDATEGAYDILGEENVASATGYWLTAEVALPEPVEVPATVEPATAEKAE